jgi:hypothetical protein
LTIDAHSIHWLARDVAEHAATCRSLYFGRTKP